MAMGQTISLFAASMIAETLIKKSSTCDQALDELYKNITDSMARREGVIVYTIMLLAILDRPICEEFVAAHMNRIQKEEQAKNDIDTALKEKEAANVN